jgi:hypothetical protein
MSHSPAYATVSRTPTFIVALSAAYPDLTPGRLLGIVSHFVSRRGERVRGAGIHAESVDH